MLDKKRLGEAFERLGTDLARRNLFLELAVYGGSAIVLQFDWRRTTEDVDALVRCDQGERLIAPSIAAVAMEMALPDDWLNNAVGMFTPLSEDDTLFEVAGHYPAEHPGLRVLLARPAYLLAMKLKALANLDRGDRDMNDARALARELGVAGRSRPSSPGSDDRGATASPRRRPRGRRPGRRRRASRTPMEAAASAMDPRRRAISG